MTMTILVCTDFTSAAAAGEREAAHRFPGARLIVFHAVDTALISRIVDLTGLDEVDLKQQMTHYADMRLNEIIGRLVSQGKRALADLVAGDPVDAALASAARHRAEMAILGVPAVTADEPGSKPTGRFRTGLARRAPFPILIIPG